MKKLLPIFFFLLSLHAHAQAWQWGRQSLGTPPTWTGGYVIAHDAYSNIYVGGLYNGGSPIFGSNTLPYHDINGTYGDFASFLAKYDSLGNLLWVRSSNDSEVVISSIVVDNSGNIYVLGSFDHYISFGSFSINYLYSKFFMAKFDSAGNMLWLKQPISSPSHIEATSMTIDSANNIYIAGFFKSSMIVFGNDTLRNTSDTDLFVAKYDTAGNALWGRQSKNGQFHTAGFECPDQYSFVTTSADNVGNVYLVGYNYYFSSQTDTIAFNSDTLYSPTVFFLKYSPSGTVLSAKNIGNGCQIHSMVWDKTNHLNICGQFRYESILGIDTLVNPIIYNPSTDYAALIAKMDTAANIVWVDVTGGNTNFPSLVPDAFGNVYVTGATGLGRLNPFPGYTLPSLANNLILVRYDSSGNLSYVRSAVENAGIGNAITTGPTGSFYVAGYFGDSLELSNNNLFSSTTDMFVARFNSLLQADVPSTGLPSKVLTIYPNPSYGSFTINLSSPTTQQATIIITNILGEKVKEFTTTTNQQTQIQLSAPPACLPVGTGIYFITATTNSQTTTSKIVVQ